MTPHADGRRLGFLYILAATAIAGACGYVIQLAAPVFLDDPHEYLAFSVFWSTLFLFVSGVSGVQQEVSRATHPAVDAPKSRTLGTFALGAVGVLAVVAVLVGFALATSAFAAAPVDLTFWFGVGLIGYLFFAVLGGILYGLERWRTIALVTVADAVVRALFVTVGLVLGLPTAPLAAGIALPFGLVAAGVWAVVRGRVAHGYTVDVGVRQISLNALGTAIGAGAMGILVTGLPLLLRTAMPGADAAALAGLILVITVTRAPLIIPLMALQSFLIVVFRKGIVHPWAVLSRYLLLLAAVTAALAVAAWLWLPSLIAWLSQDRFHADPWVCAIVVVSGGLVGAICITGPALLARSRHAWFVAGWVVAAGVTIALLAIPAPMTTRVALALLVPPVVGVVIHVLGVRRPVEAGDVLADEVEPGPVL